jgi:hypothetical protein
MNSYRKLSFVFAMTLATVCGYLALSPCSLFAAVNDVSGTYHSNRGDVTLSQSGFPPVVTGLLKGPQGDVYLIGFLRDNGRLLLLLAGQRDDGSAVLNVTSDGDRIEGTVRLHRSRLKVSWNLWKQ